MQIIAPHSPGVSSNGEEISRLISAAVVSQEFCNLLLVNPALAMAKGYRGESFRLAAEDQELVLSIRATSLSDFALQLTQSRNGNGYKHNGNGYKHNGGKDNGR
jgi:hypothetical protein